MVKCNQSPERRRGEAPGPVFSLRPLATRARASHGRTRPLNGAVIIIVKQRAWRHCNLSGSCSCRDDAMILHPRGHQVRASKLQRSIARCVRTRCNARSAFYRMRIAGTGTNGDAILLELSVFEFVIKQTFEFD